MRLDPNGPNRDGSTQEARQGWSIYTQASAGASDTPLADSAPCDCCNCSTYQRYEYTSLADYMRGPDAVTVSWSMMTTGQTYTYDANGSLYATPFDINPRKPMGPDVGKGFSNMRSALRIGGNISLVWLNQLDTPTGQEMNNFFTGPALTFSGGAKGVGGGITYSPGNGTATNLGAYTPGGGVSGAGAFKVTETRFRWR